MVVVGKAPFAEVSRAGIAELSAFNARVFNGYIHGSIEALYQSFKITGVKDILLSFHDIREQKGMPPMSNVTFEETRSYYSELWDLFFDANPMWLHQLKEYNGFTDRFGKEGNVCQATEIYRIVVGDTDEDFENEDDCYDDVTLI